MSSNNTRGYIAAPRSTWNAFLLMHDLDISQTSQAKHQ